MMKFILPMLIMILMKNSANVKILISLLVFMLNTSLIQTETTKMSYIFMQDSLSFWIINLTFWLTLIMIHLQVNRKIYINLTMTMSIILTLTFCSWNFLLFFILFEMSMITIMVMIMMWGYQPERAEAVIFMIMMTLMVSLPFLVTMMNMASLNYWFMSMDLTMWFYVSFMLIFMMKMPVFFLHFWLPKVHVESPVQGSMILAAVMLKLGSYGLIRSLPLVTAMNKQIMFIIVPFGTWTTIILSIVCLTQTDLKTTIAYSSIVHMATVFIAITINKTKSINGSIMIMIGHGMCSSGMFYIANFIYKTSKSRSYLMNKGLMSLIPISNLMWFCLCMGNAPMPPSLNILGEFLSFKALTNWSSLNFIPMILIMFFSSFYSIYLYYMPTHSQFSKFMNNLTKMSSKIKMVTMIHILPMIALTIKPQLLTI